MLSTMALSLSCTLRQHSHFDLAHLILGDVECGRAKGVAVLECNGWLQITSASELHPAGIQLYGRETLNE